jgi:MoaA/NifB/PqqE/SkfB family radical SAM enzyme
MNRYFDMNGTVSLPKMVEIDPVETCNIRCRMCHVSFMPSEKHPVFDVNLLPKLKALEGAFASIGSGFEPLLYNDFDRLMGGFADLGVRMQLITNGTLLNKNKLQTLLDCDMDIVNFSFDGIRKETFEHIRRGADHAETLRNILDARAGFAGRQTAFLINTTTMRSNLEESLEILDFWDRHDFDVVRFLPMVVRYPDQELIQESLYPIKEDMKRVFDGAAAHLIENNLKTVMLLPYLYPSKTRERFPDNYDGLYVCSNNPAKRKVLSLRERFQLGDHPLMRFYDCRAAFTTATILANGDIQLCYKYSIGNLHEDSFEDIWFGEEANRVRRLIVGEPTDCAACDCFKFGIAFHKLDADCVENYFTGELGAYVNDVDFMTGLIHAKVTPKPPRLVLSEGNYNVVAYGDKYFGIPHTLGPLEVDRADFSTMPNVIVEGRFATALARVRKIVSQGCTPSEVTPRPPQLVLSEGDYNIVAYDGKYFGIPHHLGPLEVDRTDFSTIPDVVVEEELESALSHVRKIAKSRIFFR